MAPGVILLSTYPQNLCSTGTHDVEDTIHFSNGYHLATGTSMAAPVVTGIAALMLSMDPSLEASDIKEIIMITVEYSQTNLAVVNAYNALTEVLDWMS